MDEQKIYAVLARMKDTSAADLVAELGVNLAVISEALRTAVELGVVARTKGFNIQGAPAQLYNLTAEFKTTRAYAALIGVPHEAPVPTMGAAIVIAPDVVVERPAIEPAADQPSAIIAASEAPAESPPSPAAPGAIYQCGLWSTGVLELQRNGSTVVRLQRRKGERLPALFKRMLAASIDATVQTSAHQG